MLAQHSTKSHFSSIDQHPISENYFQVNNTSNYEDSDASDDLPIDSDDSAQEPGWEDEAIKAGELFYIQNEDDTVAIVDQIDTSMKISFQDPSAICEKFQTEIVVDLTSMALTRHRLYDVI